ncbi:hypothetical protein [Flavobacterium sp.]
MKKYLFLVMVAFGFISISCTTDAEDISTSSVPYELQNFDTSLVQKDGDSISEGDTGGQGGNGPIKP